MKRRRIAAFLILLAAIGLMAFAGTQLYGTMRDYREGNAAYDSLRDQVRGSGDRDAEARIPLVDIPPLDIDFGALKGINEETVAWLYCPDTEIDYPVMESDNYIYYLSHLPDGASNANGTLFIDYNNASDFSDRLTVIYGHHMRSGAMFGSLVGYKAQGYYDEHPYMYLYTEKGNYRIDLIYGCVTGAGEWRERAFMFEENVDELVSFAAHHTTFESGAAYKAGAAGDRIVAMSTCSYEFDNARYVVLGILRPEY